MNKQAEYNDQYLREPRFYYIKVKNIKKISNQFPENKNYRLIFKLGDKSSQTNFSLGNIRTLSDKDIDRFKQQTHMFCYEAQQILVVSFGEDNKKANIIGYSNVLLTPLIKMPHTRHDLTINMVFRNKDKSINKDVSAILEIQLYFLLKFKAKLQIEPLYANLTRNTASFGQMKPFLRFQINGKDAVSDIVENGGIHPKWPGYYNIKKTNNPVESPLNKNQQAFIFDLDSVGNKLEIIMISLGMFGGQPQQIGRVDLKLQNFGFFRKPNFDIILQQKEAITLFYQDAQNKELQQGERNKAAGKLAIRTKLLFELQHTKVIQD